MNCNEIMVLPRTESEAKPSLAGGRGRCDHEPHNPPLPLSLEKKGYDITGLAGSGVETWLERSRSFAVSTNVLFLSSFLDAALAFSRVCAGLCGHLCKPPLVFVVTNAAVTHLRTVPPVPLPLTLNLNRKPLPANRFLLTTRGTRGCVRRTYATELPSRRSCRGWSGPWTPGRPGAAEG